MIESAYKISQVPYRYIAIEGPIGVGKTSLAKALAAHYKASLIIEEPELNTFLPAFYRNESHSALAVQLSFLYQRVSKLKALDEALLADTEQLFVSDFILQKEMLFSQLSMDKDTLALYEQSQFNALSTVKQIPAPDLVVYLQADTQTLLQRIHKRGVKEELRITDEYLAAVNDAYAEFFHSYSDSPLLIVNANSIDWTLSQSDFLGLTDILEQTINGTRFYNPIAA